MTMIEKSSFNHLVFITCGEMVQRYTLVIKSQVENIVTKCKEAYAYNRVPTHF